MTTFDRRSRLVKHYATRGVDLLHRLTGPVSWDALFELKRLQTDLDNSIAELERIGHWEHSAQTVSGYTPKPEEDNPGNGFAAATQGLTKGSDL